MKAAVCHGYGPPDTLVVEEFVLLPLKKGQVRIRVHNCGINFPDLLLIHGKYQEKPAFPFIPGGEISGIVEEIAGDVSSAAAGDRVMAMPFLGGLAQQINVPAKTLIHMPHQMDFVKTAGFTGVFCKSYYALKQRARLKREETLLVLGAAGGVGLGAVQLARELGARVIAVVSTERKAAFLREHGADDVINYTREDLREAVKSLTDGRGADVIYDPAGGELFDKAIRCVNRYGRILIIGFASGRIPEYPTNLALLKECSLVGVFLWSILQGKPGTGDGEY